MKYYFKCPDCGSDDGFTRPEEQSSGTGCLLFMASGIIATLIYADAQSGRVQCDRCGYIFRQPPLPRTGVAKLGTAILVIALIAFFAAVTLILSPKVAEAVPQPQLVRDLVLNISSHTGAFVVLVGVTTAIILSICFVAVIASSFSQRRRLSEEFELRPKRRGVTTNFPQCAGPVSSEAPPNSSPNEPST